MIRLPTQPSTSPATMATTAEITNSSAVCSAEKLPVTTAWTATLYSTIAVTSLNRPSPSSTDISRRGSPSRSASALTATGSGGATTAPSTSAAATGTAGYQIWKIAATVTAVTMTRPTARNRIGPALPANCCHDV